MISFAKILNLDYQGTSLVVQWLRLHGSIAGSGGSIPGQGAKIPHASGYGKK